MRFHTVLQRNGKTATGIEVPPEIVAGLEAGKKPAVRVTLNGHSYPSTVASMGGKFMIPVSAEVRKHAGLEAGDDVEVDLELDTKPREVVLPPDFQAALANDAEARTFFQGLSYSNKRRVVLPIGEAKTDDTRQRRIAKSVAKLREGKV